MKSTGKSLFPLLSLLPWVVAGLPAAVQAQAPPSCVQGEVGQVIVNQAFTPQRGRFTTTVDVTPSNDALQNLVGLSQGAGGADNLFAALVRFNAEGLIEARNGALFTAERRLRYHPELTYRLRLDVDLARRSYSVWVQQQGGRKLRPFVRVARDFAFNPQQLGITQLDTLGLRQSAGTAAPDYTTGDALQACNLKVQPPAPLPPNADCTLIVPANPLSPEGLATPYELVATDPAQGACHQAHPDQAAFVQAAVIDPATGQVAIYAPLVIDKGTRPAAAPVVPELPPNAVVALWFGYNGDNLSLRSQGRRNALQAARCVNGLGNSVFGQFAYCNAPAFFEVANRAIRSGKLVVPPLGTGVDGQMCPSPRSYWVIDQDPSDNVPTEYLDVNGQFAQATAANRARFPGARKFGNPSDERLVSVVLDPVLGCTPFSAPDLADPGSQVTALALNELQAAAHQPRPVALIPPQDPMVLVDGERSLAKLNAFRAGVGQPRASDTSDAAARAACQDYRNEAPARFVLDQPWFVNAPSPMADVANNLYTFLASRYVASYGLLDCRALLRKRVNMKLTTNGAGVVVDATLTR